MSYEKKYLRSMHLLKKKSLIVGILIMTTIFLAACQSQVPTAIEVAANATVAPIQTEAPTVEVDEPAVIPAVVVLDQSIENGSVTVSEVTSDGAGWLVIHAEAEGKPGPVLGFTAVKGGENLNVVVGIDETSATETLFAMLLTDEGEVGTWEFPDGPDAPVKVDGNVVTPAFKLLAAAADQESDDLLISLNSTDELGQFLVGPDGMTLYLFTNDDDGVTNCYGKCAENWPPLLLAEGQSIIAGDGVVGEFGTAERTDAGEMVTYNGIPLYYWIKDEAVGDTTGHGVGSVWAVVGPETKMYVIDPTASQASYEVGETFLDDNRFAEAVGVTSGINAKVYLDLSNPLASFVSPIEVDISQLTSDSGRRDDKIRSDFLESSAYPIATFAPKQIDGLPDARGGGNSLRIAQRGIAVEI